MISNIPPELTIFSFSAIGVLTGYIWNDQTRRISKLEKHTQTCPVPAINATIAEIKTDIKWIKQSLEQEKWQ